MEMLRSLFSRRDVFVALYAANLFFSFHIFFTIYINSTYLAEYLSEKNVGYLFMAGSVFSIITMFTISSILRRYGNYWVMLAVAIAEFFAVLGIAAITNIYILIPLFLVLLVTSQLIFYLFDVFLETYSKTEESTGSIRGIFLTVSNFALILSPIIVAIVLVDDAYWKLYLLSAIMIIPFIWILGTATKDFEDREYRSFNPFSTFPCIWANKDLRLIMYNQFLLRLFFSWVVIYIPIYLTQHVGLSWQEFGVVLSIGLLAYFLELPMGWLADNVMGEKELMMIGYIVLGLTLVFMSVFTVPNVLFWIALVFINRVGAGMVEIMSESYFFKHVDGEDVNTVSTFRMTRPIAYIVGPLIATVALAYMDFQYIFLALAVVIFTGTITTLFINDTK